VRHAGEATSSTAVREQLDELRACKIEREVVDAAVGPDVRREVGDEIGLLQQLERSPSMAGQQEVVVAQVADNGGARVPQGLVAQQLPVSLSLRPVVEPNPGIHEERLDGQARVVLHAIADDEDLDLGVLLREGAT